MRYEPTPEGNIYTYAQDASKMAVMSRQDVEFQFKGINLRVTPFSDPDDIVEIFSLKLEIIRLKAKM